jgi:hypothetical protein
MPEGVQDVRQRQQSAAPTPTPALSAVAATSSRDSAMISCTVGTENVPQNGSDMKLPWRSSGHPVVRCIILSPGRKYGFGLEI